MHAAFFSLSLSLRKIYSDSKNGVNFHSIFTTCMHIHVSDHYFWSEYRSSEIPLIDRFTNIFKFMDVSSPETK